jgi:hypothetical protein
MAVVVQTTPAKFDLGNSYSELVFMLLSSISPPVRNCLFELVLYQKYKEKL